MRKRIQIALGDIVGQEVEAVVTAANSELRGGGGVDGAVHRAAGPELLAAARALAPCPPGEARTTRGFRLFAPWVIHAVGPIWRGGRQGEARLLASAYQNALREAVRVGARSIAFPAISTGVYGYPHEEAARIAVQAVADFLRREGSIREVRLVCFTEASAALHRAALATLPAESGPCELA
jgi:O-acetyl-ADP-ribose deacetylase (regulator of RNase III)